MPVPSTGTEVEIQGLKSRGDLNGKRGRVTGYDKEADRIEVSFEGGAKIKVKPVNSIAVKDLKRPSDGLVVGTCVEIQGLQSRPDLNLRRGSVSARDDAAGRIEVQLDGLTPGERVKLKPSNLKTCKDGIRVGVQVEVDGLTSRSDLNGRRGMVVGREVAVDFLGNDRWEVHLDGLNGGERIKCKLTNVKLASTKLDLSAAVEMAAAAARAKVGSRSRFDEGSDRHGQDQEPEPYRAQDQRDDRDRRDPRYDRDDRDRYRDSRDDRDRHRDDRRDERDRSRDRSRGRDRRDRSRSRQRSAAPAPAGGKGDGGKSRGKGDGTCNFTLRNGVVEDRSADWVCNCGERNFAKRDNCFRCKGPRPTEAPSYKGISHMLEKQMAEEQRVRRSMRRENPLGDWVPAKGLLQKDDWDALRKKVDERTLRKEKKKPIKSSSSSSSSSESSESSKASVVKEASKAEPEAPAPQVDTELDKLKNEALQALLQIRDQPPEQRKKAWKKLLFEWHPDKHPENTENATAVFQFLQKGKGLLG
mmetsp:Transcript_34631/g.62802  ORF Transcript_34631/g.62802 Transcript_34631/m.62802 type:complete len:529 (-) Transcript_34631:46-1632(-)